MAGSIEHHSAVTWHRKQGLRLRRIEVWDEDKQETFIFVSNHLRLAASTIDRIYRERWQIETFFESSTWCTPLDVM